MRVYPLSFWDKPSLRQRAHYKWVDEKQKALDYPVLAETTVHQGSFCSLQWPGSLPCDGRWIYLLDAGDRLAVAIPQEIPWDGKLVDGYRPDPMYILYVTYLPREEDYWPSEDLIKQFMPTWVQRMFLVLKYGEDNDQEVSDLRDHWLYEDRRYGLKRNPFCRFLYLLRLDPDGRSRIGYVYPPDRMIAAMQEVDRQVGLLCGVSENEMEDRLVEFP